jgi:hypothetical protein
MFGCQVQSGSRLYKEKVITVNIVILWMNKVRGADNHLPTRQMRIEFIGLASKNTNPLASLASFFPSH